MKSNRLKNVVIGGLAVVLLCLLLRQIHSVREFENIKFETSAREKMQKAVATFDALFSETDSVSNALLQSPNAGQKELEALLKTKHYSSFLSDIYIIPSGGGSQQWMAEATSHPDIFWGGPVFDSAHNRRMLYCSVPLKTDGEKKTNLLFLYDARKIHQLLLETGLSRFGIPYIIDSTTHFVAHPLEETRSLLEVGYTYHDAVLVEMSKDIISRRPLKNNYHHVNTITHSICDEVLFPIGKTGWLLRLSVYDGIPLETGEYQKNMRQCYIQIIIYCAMLLLLICKLLTNKRLLMNVLLLLTISSIVITYNRYPQQSAMTMDAEPITKWDPKRIIDRQSLNSFVDVYQQESMTLYNETAKVIPTGVYIYSVEFLNSHTIKVNGTFWQKYLISGMSYPTEMTTKYPFDTYENKGLFFPGGHVSNLELIDSLEVLLENYPAVLYRWNFDMETEQQLSYSLYPFGKNDLSLTLWSNDLDDNTLLTPDLEAYQQIYPTDKPGLDNHFYVKGWDVSGSYYSYSIESYLCNFGNNDMYGVNKFPELIYNISISRKFIDILICKIVPLMVVLVLLFTILFVRVKSDGFNNIIGCSGLFFVLVLDHINLRESVLSEQIMYLEFCYFLSYILLLLITITSFDIGQNGRSYNLWVDTVLKKYFWTIIFGAMAIITAVFFY